MVFKRFGESQPGKIPFKQWYESPGEKRTYCDEEAINILWCNWVASCNSKRRDTKAYVIFEFIEPVELDLATAEAWVVCDFKPRNT